MNAYKKNHVWVCIFNVFELILKYLMRILLLNLQAFLSSKKVFNDNSVIEKLFKIHQQILNIFKILPLLLFIIVQYYIIYASHHNIQNATTYLLKISSF